MLFVWSRVTLWLLLGLAVAPCCVAQQGQTPAPEGGASGLTLHVTVKELQVAALVLDVHHRAVTEIDKSRFRLQVDDAKPFSPTTVHRSGDDPITLAILVDLSEPRRYHAQLAEAIAATREKLLLPHDHLILFAVDCSILTYRGDTATPEDVRAGVEAILSSPHLHAPGNRNRTCSDHLLLWDASKLAMSKLANAPGRHALLLVSDGQDTASVTPMFDLARFSTLTGTTLFVLPSTDMRYPNGPKGSLETLAVRTGGALLDSPARNHLERSFEDCVSLLRDRYILGFNQPQNAKMGDHVIQTTVQHGSYLVRTSGVSVPLSFSDEPTATVGQDASSDPPAKP